MLQRSELQCWPIILCSHILPFSPFEATTEEGTNNTDTLTTICSCVSFKVLLQLVLPVRVCLELCLTLLKGLKIHCKNTWWLLSFVKQQPWVFRLMGRKHLLNSSCTEALLNCHAVWIKNPLAYRDKDLTVNQEGRSQVATATTTKPESHVKKGCM